MVKVSVCIPVFNMAAFIGKAIDSVLAQSFSDFEVVVCDNCSSDGTREILENYSDPRVKVFYNETNIGMTGNFNRVLEKSSGTYIKILEADDMLFPEALSWGVLMFEENPSVGLLSMEREVINTDGRILRKIPMTQEESILDHQSNPMTENGRRCHRYRLPPKAFQK